MSDDSKIPGYLACGYCDTSHTLGSAYDGCCGFSCAMQMAERDGCEAERARIERIINEYRADAHKAQEREHANGWDDDALRTGHEINVYGALLDAIERGDHA